MNKNPTKELVMVRFTTWFPVGIKQLLLKGVRAASQGGCAGPADNFSPQCGSIHNSQRAEKPK